MLSSEGLDAIGAVVTPGADLAAHEQFDTPSVLPEPSLPRRRLS
ncbi:hypothetical protein [Streptomyces sp. IBSBF 3136]